MSEGLKIYLIAITTALAITSMIFIGLTQYTITELSNRISDQEQIIEELLLEKEVN